MLKYAGIQREKRLKAQFFLEKLKCILLMVLLTIWFLDKGYLISAQDLSYESDIAYILTEYMLGDYEEVIRLLNKHYFNYQNELAYLYGLCYLKLNMNKIAIDLFTNHRNDKLKV